MTMLLLFAVIFLGMQLLNPNKGPVDNRKYSEVLTKLRELNRDEKDVEAMALLPVYQQKIGEARTKEKWDQKKFESAELEGIFLVAHAKYKGALSRMNDPQKVSLVHKKLTDSWNLLQNNYQKYHALPLWSEQFRVTPDSKFNSSSLSVGSFYDELVNTLSQKNKTELVWGLFPGFPFIDFFVKMTGSKPEFSYWFAAFTLALFVRAVIYPWSMKQYRLSKQMMQLQPYIKEIQDKFRDKKTKQIPPDKQAQASAETMALYKEYGLNPFGGCSSALLQMPIYMIVLAAMQFYRFEFVKGTFLWMNPTSTKFLGLNLAPNLGQPDQLLIIIYGISMIVSQYLMPITDPSQVKQQRLMGFGISIMITLGMFTYALPSAFTLYWVFANILATVQAFYAYRMPSPPIQKVQTVPGGIRPKAGFMEKLQEMMETQNQANQNNNGKKQDSGPTEPENRVDPALFGKAGGSKTRKK